MEEKMGTMIIDGKLVNVDKLTKEQLDKYIEKLEKEEAEIRKQIDELLNV